MAKTYTITLRHSSPWAGAEGEETYELSDFGYSDGRWDALTESEQDRIVEELAEEEFWNAGYEFSGKVNRG